MGKTKDSGLSGSRQSPESRLLLISSSVQFLLVDVIPKYWNSATVVKDLLVVHMSLC